jgi:hypothetical protein
VAKVLPLLLLHYLTLVLLTLVRVGIIGGKKKEQQLVPNHRASKTILWAVVLKSSNFQKALITQFEGTVLQRIPRT